MDDSGVLRFDNAIGWRGRMGQLRGKRVVVTVEAEQPRRSTNANSRYWAVLVPLAGHLLSKDRPIPFNKKQVHHVLATAFVGSEETPLGLVPMETHTLTKEQFHVFTTKVEAWLGENGYSIPEMGEPIEAEL